MIWFAARPRDPADPRWPLPETLRITLKAENTDATRRRFEKVYPSEPFGTPGHPIGDGGSSFRGDAEALVVVVGIDAPLAPNT